MRHVEAQYEEGLLKPKTGLALRPGERVSLIVLRHTDPDCSQDQRPSNEGELILSDVVTPEGRHLQDELIEYLCQCIHDLPTHLREPMLRRLSDQSYRSIAEELAITETKARERVREARGILARRFHQYRVGETDAPGEPRATTTSDEKEARAAAHSRWDLEKLAKAQHSEDLTLAEQGLAQWADTLNGEDGG